MYLTFLFNNFILISLFIWYCSHLFSLKDKYKYLHIFIVLMFIFIKSFINLSQNFPMNVLTTIIVYILILRFLFIGEFFSELIFSSVFIISSFIGEILTSIILDGLVILIPTLSHPYLYLVCGMIISTIFLFSTAYLIIKYNDIKGTYDASYIWYLSLFPITTVIVIFAILKLNLMKSEPVLSFISTLGLLVSNFIIFKLFIDVIDSKNIQLDNELLRNKELIYEMQNKMVEEKIENSKQFIHDFNKHIRIISTYISHEEYDKTKEYINELNLDMQLNTINYVTGNQIIDYAINSKYDDIQKYKIDLKYDIKLKEIPYISHKDFNILFSNILENAIESCIQAQSSHFIKIKLSAMNNMLILKVINSCDSVNKNYETTKKNKEFHGYGLKIIKNITHKYDGSYHFHFNEEYHVFETVILLPMSVNVKE